MGNLILAVDCSLQSLTLALFTHDAVIAEVALPPLAQQSSLLLKKIDELLKKSGHTLSDVTDVLYAYGPGSFTSLRIGLATLHGLFLNSLVKLHVVSSLFLRCLSVQNESGKKIVSAMKAGQDNFYVGIWDGEKFSEDLMNREQTSYVMATPKMGTGDDVVTANAFRKIWNEKKMTSVEWTAVKLNYQQKAV